MQFVKNVKARRFIGKLRKYPGKSFRDMFGQWSPSAIDLLTRMLQWNPAKRISVDDALAHPFLRAYSDPHLDIKCPNPFDWTYERDLHETKDIKTALLHDIARMRGISVDDPKPVQRTFRTRLAEAQPSRKSNPRPSQAKSSASYLKKSGSSKTVQNHIMGCGRCSVLQQDSDEECLEGVFSPSTRPRASHANRRSQRTTADIKKRISNFRARKYRRDKTQGKRRS